MKRSISLVDHMNDEENTVQDTENPDSATAAAPAKEETVTDEAKAEAPEAGADKPAEKTPEELAKAASEAGKTLQRHKQSASEAVQQAKGKQRDAERRAAALAKENAELRARLKAPDPSQFTDDADYTAAKLEHKLDERQIAKNDAQIKDAEQERYDAIAQSWRSRTEDFKAEASDFDEVVYAKLNNRISGETAMLIAELDEGPAVAYHLGKNLSEATRINGLSEREKAFELGKIASRISQPPPRKITQAPGPIESVGGKSSGGSGFNPHKASYEEFSDRYQKMKARGA